MKSKFEKLQTNEAESFKSKIERLLLVEASSIVESNPAKEWYEFDSTPVNMTDEDVRVCDAFYKALFELCPYFYESKKSRTKYDERVQTYKDYFRYKRIPFGYTIQRVVIRDPDYSTATGDIHSSLTDATYQIDFIDSYSRKVEHIKGSSMLDACSRALEKSVDFFGLKPLTV